MLPTPPLLTFGAALLLGAIGPSAPVQEALCAEAHALLVSEMDMAAVIEPDTVDDWRTNAVTPGCRITAAGITRVSMRQQAASFFDDLRAAGWSRTPEPRDAPNEASLRFRKGGADCLFSFYSGGLLGTEAEARVDDDRVPESGERRYNYLVQCVPAAEAAPRG